MPAPVICTIDIETSGFDKDVDEITEIAWSIKRHGVQRSLVDRVFYVQHNDLFISEEITNLTGIKTGHCERYGVPYELIEKALVADVMKTQTEYMAAHNGNYFDRPFLVEKMPGLDFALIPWLDTYRDIQYPPHFRCHQISHLCVEYGFLNPFPHNAMADVWTTAKVLDQFDIDDVITRSKSPDTVIQALVSYERRDEAKTLKYRWENLGDKKYPKKWVKLVKEMDLEREREMAIFDIEVLG